MEAVAVNGSRENIAAVFRVEFAPSIHGGDDSGAQLIALLVPIVLRSEMDGDFFAVARAQQRPLTVNFLDLSDYAYPIQIPTGIGGMTFHVAGWLGCCRYNERHKKQRNRGKFTDLHDEPHTLNRLFCPLDKNRCPKV